MMGTLSSTSILLITCLSLSSCTYNQSPKLCQSLFDKVMIYNPKEAQSEKDALQSYIDLWEAYKNNLLLLDTIKDMQKQGK